ncbi:MAG: tRNA-2-methylthio-N6-dimethylallyladenosine synthase, partial [Microbacteriaceae bacterium]|nr:tRNA-2-methylthio-N6-dimethylallyladenosine synthase [Microbacteriaceae bacterium]
DRVRERIPGAAITTDLIVGFPGETEEDFEDTLRVVERARFASAFTFQYSIRPGTPAATLPDQMPKAVVQQRYERLLELQERISWAGNRELLGTEVEVLVGTGEGRKDGATSRISGRARDNRLVHVGLPDAAPRPRPGDLVTVPVTGAAPAYLIADVPAGQTPVLERTRAGDAWDAREAAACAVPAPSTAGRPVVSLGLPGLRHG